MEVYFVVINRFGIAGGGGLFFTLFLGELTPGELACSWPWACLGFSQWSWLPFQGGGLCRPFLGPWLICVICLWLFCAAWFWQSLVPTWSLWALRFPNSSLKGVISLVSSLNIATGSWVDIPSTRRCAFLNFSGGLYAADGTSKILWRGRW